LARAISLAAAPGDDFRVGIERAIAPGCGGTSAAHVKFTDSGLAPFA
jgi:hypothetical protein